MKNWFILDAQAIDDIRYSLTNAITQGEIMLRANCPRKWYYRYGLNLQKRGVLDFNLVYGSLMHKLLEKLYSHKNAYSLSPEDEPLEVTDEMFKEITDEYVLRPSDYLELELVRAKVQIAFDAYRKRYYSIDAKLLIKGVEKTLEYDFEGLHLVGKVDLIARPSRNDGTFIWDFKTAGHLDAAALDAWTFKFQFLFYCWLFWKLTRVKPTGTMISGLLKTGLRPKIVDRKTKRRENEEEYLRRVKVDMAVHREEYFYRQRVPLLTGALERFENEVLMPHIDAFRLLAKSDSIDIVNALAFQMNTGHCHMYNSYCEYLSLCKDGRLALGEFDQRVEKHVELEK
jgi:hypothetical protein